MLVVGEAGQTLWAMDNFDLSLSMQESGQDSSSNAAYLDQTFHTPSFGDEEFEIPPINLQGVGGHAPADDGNPSTDPGVYGAQQQQQQQQAAQRMGSPPMGNLMQPMTYPSGQGAPYHMEPMRMPPQSVHMSVPSYEPQGTYVASARQYPSPPNSLNPMMGPPVVRGGPGRTGSVGSGSPPGSNQTSPGQETTSEDSDDSTPLSQLVGGVKRPSPEPLLVDNGKMSKKAKMPKKKKKRDPNEPQKPVSAYALFFRDTQAAIKGQNPNASFGEVSKIVASMWDSLEADHKNVYKKKTEAAKKEYLKALAAYRASLVSKAAADHSDTMYGGPVSSTSPPQGNLSPLQKKSPLLTSLMEGGSPHQQYMAMSPPQGAYNPQQQVWSNMQPMNQSPPMMQQGQAMMPMQHSPPQQQAMIPQQHSPPQPQMMMSSPPATSSYAADMMPGEWAGARWNFGAQQPSTVPTSVTSSGSMMGADQGPMMNAAGGLCNQRCIRNGCPNPAIDSHDWDREYCSSECVVSHCRDVFTAWVAQRQATNTFVK
ncbi:TOX high mobility group box family member 4-like isoform X2 [Ornithodoros turicata]|uniref:Putative hmg box-containing protein n=1 Tax=Ornithodoros turicata TaxID=34597 RepID=A0A2R5LEW9_9ACAR